MLKGVKRFTATIALALFVCAIAWAASAADGKWTWKQRGGQGGNEVGMMLELKVDGEKVTGTVVREGSDQKTEISEGKIKDSDVSFVVVREFNGNQFKTTYKGKIEGDSIKGTRTSVRQGQENSVEWVATRSK